MLRNLLVKYGSKTGLIFNLANFKAQNKIKITNSLLV